MVFQTREDANQGAFLGHLRVRARVVLVHTQAPLPRMLTSFPDPLKVVGCSKVPFHRNPALCHAGRCQTPCPLVMTLLWDVSRPNRLRTQIGACLRVENEVRQWGLLA
jgi:hypothetical protein